MNRIPSHPRDGFILITDGFGDPQEIHSHNCVIDEVMRRCEVLDRENPGDSPHTAWSFRSENGSGGGVFLRVRG